MPMDDRLRLEDLQHVQHFGCQTIETGKHQAIDVCESDPFGKLTPQDVELVPKDYDLGLQRIPDRNNPSTAHQIKLQRSPMATIISRFAANRQPY
jgi:hypothetical protein